MIIVKGVLFLLEASLLHDAEPLITYGRMSSALIGIQRDYFTLM